MVVVGGGGGVLQVCIVPAAQYSLKAGLHTITELLSSLSLSVAGRALAGKTMLCLRWDLVSP